MEKLKKILMIISLSGVGASALLLILQVLGVPIFNNFMLRILLITATIAVASGISINEIGVIKRKRILGLVGLCLLALSSLFAIIVFSTDLLVTYSVFNKITGVVALNSIMFIIIITQYSRVGRAVKGLQIPTYICLVLLDIILSLTISGVDILSKIITPFIILCIATVALLIALSVISSKIKNTEPTVSIKKDIVTISREEYENLKKENAELKAKLETLKNEKSE